MARLEELTRGAAVKGILANGLVTIINIRSLLDSLFRIPGCELSILIMLGT
jgi:hypothetical protein